MEIGIIYMTINKIWEQNYQADGTNFEGGKRSKKKQIYPEGKIVYSMPWPSAEPSISHVYK